MLCSNAFPRYQFLGAGALISSRQSPTAAIIDSQTVPAADTVPRSSRGWDGGKRTNGVKRHIAVDVNGLLLSLTSPKPSTSPEHSQTGGGWAKSWAARQWPPCWARAIRSQRAWQPKKAATSPRQSVTGSCRVSAASA